MTILSRKQIQHRSYRWYALVILALGYTSSHVDRQIMAIVLQPIKEEMGATDTQMGFLIGLTFAIFYATLGMPIAWLADRSNRRNIIAIAVTVWSAMTVACGYAANYFQLALARIGVAIGEAGSTPPSHSIISDMFASHERATAMAIYAAGVNLGLLIAYLGGGWLVDNWGWRATFIAVGVPGLFLALLMMATVIEPERTGSKAATKTEEEPPPAEEESPSAEVSEPLAAETSEPPPAFRETVVYMFTHPSLFHLVIGLSLASFVGYGMVLWVPTFMVRTHELSLTEAGFIMAMLIGVGGGIGTLLAGRIVDYVGRRSDAWRSWSVTVSQLLPLPLVMGFLLVDHLPTAVVCYVLPTMFGAFYLPPSFALIQQLVKVRMRAVASAITLFIANMIGLGIGPQAIGILSDILEPTFGIHSLRYALAVFSFVGCWSAFHYWRAGSYMAQSTEPLTLR